MEDSDLVISQIENISDQHINLLLLADPSVSLIREYLSKGACFALKKSDGLIGIIALMPISPKTLEIMNIAVANNQQGQGYGTHLIQFAIQHAKKHSFTTLEIGTGNSSFAQLYLYQKCGFRIIAIDRDFFLRHYNEKIYENGIQCVDMVRLSIRLDDQK